MQINKKSILKNGKQIIIRNAIESDAKIVTDISNTVIKETRFLSRTPEDKVERVEDTCEYIIDCLDSPNESFLVAEYEDKIVGFAHLDSNGYRIKYRHRSSIALSILKDYWGLGIGGRLMITLIEQAKTAGYEQIELSVIEENTSAVNMYQSFGFEIYGREPHAMKFSENEYGDYLSMVKFL